MYVIQRINGNKFVSLSGSHDAYTNDLLKAKIFIFKSNAEKDCCGNEKTVEISELLKDNMI